MKNFLCKFYETNEEIFICKTPINENENENFKFKSPLKIKFNIYQKIDFDKSVCGLFCYPKENNKGFENKVLLLENITLEKKQEEDSDFYIMYFKNSTLITVKDFKNINFHQIEEFKKIISTRIMVKTVNI